MDRNRPTKEQMHAIVSEHIAEQYARGSIIADPVQELEWLHAELVGFAKAYEESLTSQRQAICDTIIAIAKFLMDQGYSSHTLTPLNRVVGAIVGICDQNRPDPLFCEKKERTKPKRSMEDSIRQGQLAALVDAWLASCGGEKSEVKNLRRAARVMSGSHFGDLDPAALKSARSYQRQTGHHILLYRSCEQMTAILKSEADAVGGGAQALRQAVELQIKALNYKSKLNKP